MLLTGLDSQHTSLAIYILMRAAVLASRCGIKSDKFGRICRPLAWAHGDIFLMCLSSSQILYVCFSGCKIVSWSDGLLSVLFQLILTYIHVGYSNFSCIGLWTRVHLLQLTTVLRICFFEKIKHSGSILKLVNEITSFFMHGQLSKKVQTLILENLIHLKNIFCGHSQVVEIQ